MVAHPSSIGYSVARPTEMRSLVLALCAAFAVIFTGASAHAQHSQGRCYGTLASYRPTASDQVTTPLKAAKQVVMAALPAMPSRSQAPTLCTDPSQPGCQVDCPDAPTHNGSWSAHHEPVELNTGLPEIPPQEVDLVDPAAQFHGGPRAGAMRAPWRPPSA